MKLSENRLTPIEVTGLLVPSETVLSDGTRTEYKVTCGNGTEYFIQTSSRTRDLLTLYRWNEVQIIGLHNEANDIVIPQKVFPKGSDGESSSVIDFELWRNKNVARKVLNKINELVIVPAAVLAVLVS
jgi:hypothetical protein